MSCGSCSVGCGTNLLPKGCNSNGGCSSGGCNKKNSFDWLSPAGWDDYSEYYEVSFKKGARKEIVKNSRKLDLAVGEMVIIDTKTGKDLGQISLGGELVKLNMRKRKTKSIDLDAITRLASERDIQKLAEVRAKEKKNIVKARVIARSLKLDMKIGDVEYQGDGRKLTIFYTAEDRVDFRGLIKEYAKEFQVKIEMKQIGARQEAARIGGIGDCGRELCCSTWLNDFKSVSTGAARYQNLSINQAKLSGQCGRLKCCLNYELDTYMDALKDIPQKVDRLETEAGIAYLQKTDIFRKKMFFSYKESSKYYELDVEKVKEIEALNKDGKKPVELSLYVVEKEVPETIEYKDVVGQVSLKSLERTAKRKKNKNRAASGNKNPKASSRNSKGQQNRSYKGKKKGPNTGGNPNNKKQGNQSNKRNQGPKKK